MQTSHDHAHSHAHTHARGHAQPLRAGAGISLLRLSAAARLSIAGLFSVLIWLIVYLVVYRGA